MKKKIICILIIFKIFNLSCYYNSKPFNSNYIASHYLYYTKDFFGRKYFKWILEPVEVYRQKSKHIRVFLNRKGQIMVYETNEFVQPNLIYLVDHREFSNIFESYLWYVMDGLRMIYEGSRIYFLQKRVILSTQIGFLRYDSSGRIIAEDIFNRYGKNYLNIRFEYSNNGVPLRRIEDEIISERIVNSAIIRKISRKIYKYKKQKVVKIIRKEIIQKW